MKKNKIIGLGIALLGTVISVGTAFALYQKGFGTENGIGFGGFTYQSSSGTYRFLSSLNGGNTGFEVESGHADLNPTNNTVTYTFKIAATYGTEANDLVKQDAILGKLSISKTGALKDNFTMSAYVDGYESRKVGEVEQNYWAKADSLEVRTLGGEGDTISAYIPSPTSSTASMSDAVNQGKYLTVHVTLTLNSMSDAAFMNLDQGQYSLSVRFEDVDAGYGRPYLVGDGTGWKLEDEYAMVPNLGASTYEFCFKDLNSLPNHTFSQMKVLKNKGTKDASDLWNSEKWYIFGDVSDNSANITLQAGTTYFVTYKGDNKGGFVVNGTNVYQNN